MNEQETIESLVLSENEPHSGPSNTPGFGGHTDGTRVILFKDEDGFGYCYEVCNDGSWFESEDATGYATREAALGDAIENYLERNITEDELAGWENCIESERLARIREAAGFACYHIGAKWSGSVDVIW